MMAMRGLLATILGLALGAPLVSPLLASSPKSLPACCRRNGKHRCMMAVQVSSGGPSLGAPRTVCPHFPQRATASHNNGLQAPATFAFFAAIVSHPTDHSQTEAHRRIALSRSHQKRGPPLVSA